MSGFFKLLNVAILAAVGYYLYQTHLRQLLIAALKRLHNKRSLLRNEIEQALLQAISSEAQVQEQRVFCAVAAQRLAQWRAYQQTVLNAQEAAARMQAQRLRMKYQTQAEALQLAHAREFLADNIVQQATAELQRTYTQASQGQTYIRPIIARLEQL